MPDEDELWGPVPAAEWRSVPCVQGRAATEEDVRAGRAVFYVDSSGAESKVHELKLPACAIVRPEGSGEETPAIVIQAEHLSGDTIAVGYRSIAGGNGVATLREVELLPSPDERFF